MFFIVFVQIILAIALILIVFSANKVLFQIFGYLWMIIILALATTQFNVVYGSLDVPLLFLSDFWRVIIATLFFVFPFFFTLMLIYLLSPDFRRKHKRLLGRAKWY
jgi:hypothetical protein